MQVPPIFMELPLEDQVTDDEDIKISKIRKEFYTKSK